MDESTELLDIEHAARFLNVSETSLRRWTNSGRLACLRVGRRRERRFRRGDLIAFMEDQPAGGMPAGPRMASRTGYVMIGGVAVSYGTHLCGLYSSDVGRIKQAAEFLIDGLRPGGVCLLVSPAHVHPAILEHLIESRPSLQADIAAERLILADSQGTAQAQLEYWETQMLAAQSAGARSFRVVGDLHGLGVRIPLEELLDYEARYEEVIARRFPVVTLCQYAVHEFSSLALLNTLKLHKDTFRYPAERLLA